MLPEHRRQHQHRSGSCGYLRSTPVTASIAAVCTPTAASASEPEPVIPRAGASLVDSGTGATTGINPAPCAVNIMKDRSASPACLADSRSAVRSDR